MTLAPLGFRSILQRSPLGQSVQFLQPLTPLGQSLNPLGQNFQPLSPLPPLSPFVQASLQEAPFTAPREPWMFSEFNSETGQAIAPDSNRPPESFQNEPRSEINSTAQPSVLQTQLDPDEPTKISLDSTAEQPLLQKIALPSDNLQIRPTLGASEPDPIPAEVERSLPEQSPLPMGETSGVESLAQLKPLGALPPLTQESDFLISAPSEELSPLSQPNIPEARSLSPEAVVQPRLEPPTLEETNPAARSGSAEVVPLQSSLDSPSILESSKRTTAEPEASPSEPVQSAENRLPENVSSVEPAVQRVEDALPSSSTGTEAIPVNKIEREPIALEQSFR